jgi:diguanylate cyclase (GGDEF)-like protein
VVDIDHFKRVNDTFGHVYGDEVLVLVAGILKRGFRDQDRVFRFGGEEFAVLLADVTPGQAERALERFRACVEEARFPQVGRVTVSIGVTTIVPDETGLEAFGRADEALYMAKNDGRNRLRRYETLIAQGRIFKKPKHVEKIELF